MSNTLASRAAGAIDSGVSCRRQEAANATTKHKERVASPRTSCGKQRRNPDAAIRGASLHESSRKQPFAAENKRPAARRAAEKRFGNRTQKLMRAANCCFRDDSCK